MREIVALALIAAAAVVPLSRRSVPARTAGGTGRPGMFQEQELDAPYVPTPDPVIAEMLRLAAVGKGDVLYDLGCGDGRIVLAARRLGARAVGVDIDPLRIAECGVAASRAGLASGVRFVVGDLFATDVRDASVVTLYLLTTVNLRLRPRLLAELRPGARIVSHDFGMDDWKPDATSRVEAGGRTHTVHVWTVPANVGGRWTWTAGRPRDAWEMALDQTFQFAVGTLKRNGAPLAVREVEVRGADLRVEVDAPEGEGTSLTLAGKLVRTVLEGRATLRSPSGTRTTAWKATRDPGTFKPLDTPEGKAVFLLPRKGSRPSAPAP